MSYTTYKENKAKFRTILKKYSNISLFERREKELMSAKKHKGIHPYNLLIKTINNNHNSYFRHTNNILNHKSPLQTISSFKSQLDFIFDQIKQLSPPHNLKTNFQNKKSKRTNSLPVFLTIFDKNNNNSLTSPKKIYSPSKDFLIHNKMKINSPKSFLSTEESKKNKGIEILKSLSRKDINDSSFKRYNTLTNFKIQKINLQKQSKNEFINKTRDLLLMRYTYGVKNENILRINEKYDNNFEHLTENINSLREAQTLYDINFINKLSEYVKYVLSIKESEKKKCTMLIKTTHDIKKEITKLNFKIKKIETDKNNILRWLYFQIQMKEKILTIPDYYKTIFNSDLKRTTVYRKTGPVQFGEVKIKNKEYKRTQSISQTSSKLIQHLFPIKKNEKINTIFRTKSIQKNSSLNTSSFITTHYNINNNKKEFVIDKKEVNRILNYKNYLIFDTPEEFYERLEEFENENIQKINRYNLLQIQLNEIKKTCEKIKVEKTSIDSYEDNRIISRQQQLNSLIKKFELNKKYKNELLKDNKKKMTNDNFFNKKNLNNKNNKNFILININNIYSRVESIFENLKLNYYIENSDSKTFKFTEYEFQKKKKHLSKEALIITMLGYIEYYTVDLLKKFSDYKRENFEIVKKLKSEIDKKHKVINAALLRKNLREKKQRLIEELQSRNNRILFLPKKKLDVNANNKNGNDDLFYGSNTNKCYIPDFEDFMFENDEIQTKIFKISNKYRNKSHYKTSMKKLHSRMKTG